MASEGWPLLGGDADAESFLRRKVGPAGGGKHGRYGSGQLWAGPPCCQVKEGQKVK